MEPSGQAQESTAWHPQGLFRDLSAEAMTAFHSIKSITHFPPENTVFREGDRARGVYIVCSGRVRLSVRSQSGKRIVVRNASSEEVLGLSACLSSSSYEVTAETLEDADVAVISRKNLLRFLHCHREACLQVMQLLSQDLHVAYGRLRAIGVRRRRRSPKASRPE